MKTYIIHYTGGILPNTTDKVLAPNKTLARLIFTGEHNPQIKIIKIEEEKANE